MAALDKVKVLVVGDSGVGKSSLIHLICQGEPINSPSWTVGCSVDVKLHEFKEGTPQRSTYFVELWDIGGSNSHRNARSVFYNGTHGIILVHDVTNRKSQQNLRRWLAEIVHKDDDTYMEDDFDPEQFVGSSQIPLLVVGTKLDHASAVRGSGQTRRTSSVADECGADEIFVDSNAVKSLAPGSSSAVKLSRFFDKVIEHRFRGATGNRGEYVTLEKRRQNFAPKYYHAD